MSVIREIWRAEMRMKSRLFAPALTLLLGSLASLPLMAQSYQSVTDQFEIDLPEKLYPTTLSYEQNTFYGTAQVKSLSFHSEIGKFSVDIVDYPGTDQRSPAQRMQAKINQLSRNPSLEFEQVESLVLSEAQGVMLKFFDGARPQIQAVFVVGQREFHIRSSSFEAQDLDQVLQQTETIIRSFSHFEPALESPAG